MILVLWVMLPILIFRDSFFKLLAKNFGFFRVGQFEIDEDLPNYFETLDDHDRNWSIKEEDNARTVLKMRILNDETLHRLKETRLVGDRSCQGVHSYDVLANILYIDDFQYFSADLDNRKDFIIDDDDDEDNDNAQSDLVRMILNLAYMTEEKAK